MKVFAVIMAGGVGARFWPQSRETMPKQFLKVFGSRTLYQRTFDRISALVSPENVFVVTNRVQRNLAVSQLPQLPERNVIAEPFGRNTAPCISAAVSAISSVKEDSVMVVLPADHLISEEDKFVSQLKDAVRLAEKNEHSSLSESGRHIRRRDSGIYISKATEDKDISDHGGRRVISFRENRTMIRPSNSSKAATISGTAGCLCGALT